MHIASFDAVSDRIIRSACLLFPILLSTCPTRELYDAVMANWEGYEMIRQHFLKEVPHYGNADPYADTEVK